MIEVWVRYRPEVERGLIAQLPPHSYHRIGSLHELNVKCLDRAEADLLVVNLNQQEGLEAKIKEPWRDCAARRGSC